jgi:hypothetical protein
MNYNFKHVGNNSIIDKSAVFNYPELVSISNYAATDHRAYCTTKLKVKKLRAYYTNCVDLINYQVVKTNEN